jgi:hypothetical protein
VDVADLGDEHRGQDRADTLDDLDGSIAGIVFESSMNVTLEPGDFGVEHLD